MLVYVGSLEPLFHAVLARSHNASRLAITTEVLDDSQEMDMQLLKTGRYAHSEGYVQRAAKERGFTIEVNQKSPLRKERGEWLEGGYYILKAIDES